MPINYPTVPWRQPRSSDISSDTKTAATIKPADMETHNPLRPSTFDEMIGQDKLKPLLRRLVTAARESGRPMDHLLLVGASGTGKTTTAMVIARELGSRMFLLKLVPLSEVCAWWFIRR